MEIPKRARERPIYNGLLVPYSVMVFDGVPNFRVADPGHVRRCIDERRCGLCGKKIIDEVVFTGGDLCIANRLFSDPGMHEACARYAHSVCPFLVGRITTMLPAEAAERSAPDDYTIIVDPNVSTKRPDRFGLLFTDGYRRKTIGNATYIHPNAGRVEWLVGSAS